MWEIRNEGGGFFIYGYWEVLKLFSCRQVYYILRKQARCSIWFLVSYGHCGLFRNNIFCNGKLNFLFCYGTRYYYFFFKGIMELIILRSSLYLYGFVLKSGHFFSPFLGWLIYNCMLYVKSLNNHLYILRDFRQ